MGWGGGQKISHESKISEIELSFIAKCSIYLKVTLIGKYKLALLDF